MRHDAEHRSTDGASATAPAGGAQRRDRFAAAVGTPVRAHRCCGGGAVRRRRRARSLSWVACSRRCLAASVWRVCCWAAVESGFPFSGAGANACVGTFGPQVSTLPGFVRRRVGEPSQCIVGLRRRIFRCAVAGCFVFVWGIFALRLWISGGGMVYHWCSGCIFVP